MGDGGSTIVGVRRGLEGIGLFEDKVKNLRCEAVLVLTGERLWTAL